MDETKLLGNLIVKATKDRKIDDFGTQIAYQGRIYFVTVTVREIMQAAKEE